MFTVCGEINRESAICRFVLPSAANVATLISGSVSDAHPDLGRSLPTNRRRTPRRRSLPRKRAESHSAPVRVVIDNASSKESMANACVSTCGDAHPTQVLERRRIGEGARSFSIKLGCILQVWD